MNIENSISPKKALKEIKTLFYITLLGLLLFSGVIYGAGFLSRDIITDRSIVRIIFIAVLFAGTICLTAAAHFFKKRIAVAQQEGLSLVEKLKLYRAALILYLALCEGPALFSMILFLLTGNNLFLAVTGLICLAMIMKIPEKSKIINELKLNSSEQSELH